MFINHTFEKIHKNLKTTQKSANSLLQQKEIGTNEMKTPEERIDVKKIIENVKRK